MLHRNVLCWIHQVAQSDPDMPDGSHWIYFTWLFENLYQKSHHSFSVVLFIQPMHDLYKWGYRWKRKWTSFLMIPDSVLMINPKKADTKFKTFFDEQMIKKKRWMMDFSIRFGNIDPADLMKTQIMQCKCSVQSSRQMDLRLKLAS